MNLIFSYDGTLEGFLTCVYLCYERKAEKTVTIRKKEYANETFFSTVEDVISDSKKADRVWKGMEKKTSPSGRTKIYKAFLSELPNIEDSLLGYIRYAFSSEGKIDSDFSNEDVLKVSQIARSVGREKHRMDAFVRFRLTKDNIYFANVEPDFNVLPLIISHFKSRYADQKWIIYDLKRAYGIYYDLNKVETIKLEISEDLNNHLAQNLYFSEYEQDYQKLWHNYFKSTNIKSRKNLKLHIRHVPKRYWKYLSEKLLDN